jgi:transposase InsO family protein
MSPRHTDEEREQRVVELRQRYPDWGARKLQVLLARSGVELPASTIHRILLRRGLVRPWERHETALQRFERAEPNQLWQMDFKGSKGWDRPVGPLSLLDDHSRYLIALRGTWTTRAEAVREQLESAFVECGVPEAMLMDHGTPWWNARTPTGATWLTVWLMQQGIQLHWSGYRHPQTQGKVERFHGSLQRARNYGEACPTNNGSGGWMSIVTNITRCGRMKRWACRLRQAGGAPACGSITRTPPLGNTKKARW